MSETAVARGNPVLRLFRHALPLQVKVQEALRAMGRTDRLACLNIGDEGCAMSYHLRRRGGDWQTVVSDATAAATIRDLVGAEGVHEWSGGALPFEAKTFDVVVVLNAMERQEDDHGFIEECHRVLKSDGRLVLLTSNLKAWSLIPSLRRMLGVGPDRRGMVRAGYTEGQLFNILKHGFDLNQMRTFSRFWVELVDAAALACGGRPRTEEEAAGVARCYGVAGVFYRLAFQVDLLLFFTRGFSIAVSAKRRAWLPRKTPVLSDGRSISEAVLSRLGE